MCLCVYAGQVEFVSESETRTTVILRLQHQMPWLLVDLKVGVTGLETHMRQILQENLDEFKTLAEAVAADPANAPPRQGAGAPYVPRREQQPQPAGLPLGVEGEEGEEIYIRAKDTWEGPVLGEPKQEDMQMHPLDASVVGDLQPQQPAAAVTQPEPPSRPPPVPPPAAPAAAKARQATPTQRPAPQPAEAAAPASRARRGSRTAKSVTPTVKAVSGTSVNGLPPAATPKRPGERPRHKHPHTAACVPADVALARLVAGLLCCAFIYCEELSLRVSCVCVCTCAQGEERARHDRVRHVPLAPPRHSAA